MGKSRPMSKNVKQTTVALAERDRKKKEEEEESSQR